MPSILITDGLWRKSVVAIRALGKENINVTVTGENLATSGFFSKYCHKKIILPSAKSDPQEFASQLLDEIKYNHYDLIIPMEDDTIKAILPHRQEFEKYTKIPLPSSESIEIAFNKQKTLKLAQSIGIDIPQTVFSNSKYSLNKIKLPSVIKPTESSGSRGLSYIYTTKQLKEKINYLKKSKIDFVIQEKIPQKGEETGVNLLYNHQHQIIASFTYKRLRDYPITGGPSTLRQSTYDPQLIALAKKLLDKLKWVGVAMVEFKNDPRDGKTKLMEINPRFWGSLSLPTAAGINFPYLLYQMENNIKINAKQTYKIGIKTRWLIPGDILHFLSNPNRFNLKPSFFDFFDKNTYYDDFDSTDPFGNFGVIICNLIQAFNPKMWKYILRRIN